MKKNWRPEGWDALDIYAANESICTSETDFIEAGATAMLEALRRRQQLQLSVLIELIPTWTAIPLVVPDDDEKGK